MSTSTVLFGDFTKKNMIRAQDSTPYHTAILNNNEPFLANYICAEGAGLHVFINSSSGTTYYTMTSSYVRTQRTLPMSTTGVLKFGSGVFVTLCIDVDGLTYYIYTSTDGINWTQGFSTTGWRRYPTLSYTNGVFFLIGFRDDDGMNTGKYYTSSNGTNWTTRYFPFYFTPSSYPDNWSQINTGKLTNVFYANNYYTFIGVGYASIVWRIPENFSMTTNDTIFIHSYGGVTAYDGFFALTRCPIAAYNSTVYYIPDGKTPTSLLSYSGYTCQGVTNDSLILKNTTTNKFYRLHIIDNGQFLEAYYDEIQVMSGTCPANNNAPALPTSLGLINTPISSYRVPTELCNLR